MSDPGELLEAEEAFAERVRLFEEAEGPRSPDAANTLNRLAALREARVGAAPGAPARR